MCVENSRCRGKQRRVVVVAEGRNAGAENRGESKREAGEYTHGGPICLKKVKDERRAFHHVRIPLTHQRQCVIVGKLRICKICVIQGL